MGWLASGKKPEEPKRYLVAIADLDVVRRDETVGHVRNLPKLLALPADLDKLLDDEHEAGRNEAETVSAFTIFVYLNLKAATTAALELQRAEIRRL